MNKKSIIIISTAISLLLILLFGISIINPLFGEWHGDFIGPADPKNAQKEVTLKFFPFHLLLIDFTGNENEYFNVIFSYEFLDNDQIDIKGRFHDLLTVHREKDLLTVQSTNGFIHEGIYTKRSTFLRDCIFVVPLIITIAFYSINREKSKEKSS
jgi:hypothetical protein